MSDAVCSQCGSPLTKNGNCERTVAALAASRTPSSVSPRKSLGVPATDTPAETRLELRHIEHLMDVCGDSHDALMLLGTMAIVATVIKQRDAAEARGAEPIRVDQRPNGCWAACVATITGIPLDELSQDIPADATEEWFWEHKTELHNDMVMRLRERGWRIEYTWRDIPRGFAIASGQSPRMATVQHAVVVKDGKLWHDPHPDRSGLLTTESFEILVPIVGTLPEPAR